MRVVKTLNENLGEAIVGNYDETKGVVLFLPVGYGSYYETDLQPLHELEYTEGTEEDYISFIEQNFHFGEVVKTYVVGEYQIIQSVDSENKEKYSPYIRYERIGRSYESLDEALTGVICYKYDGANSQANKFLWKMIK